MLDGLRPEQKPEAERLKSDILLQQDDIRETIRVLTGRQATAPKPEPLISPDTPLSAAPGLMVILARQVAQDERNAREAEALLAEPGAYPHEATLYTMECHTDYLSDALDTLSPILDRWQGEVSTPTELADFNACDYLDNALSSILSRQLDAIEKLKTRTVAAKVEALRPAEALNDLAEALGLPRQKPDIPLN